jgi:lincosamide nucleotidyltransferase A/C/D/E
MLQDDKPKMTAADVLDLVKLLEQNQIKIFIDGGWGVDALLGEQTRPHEDLDVVMPHKFVPLARSLLEARGYTDVPRTDTRDCNFVLGDNLGHLIDFHTYTYDEQGSLVFGLPYPLDSLNGTGSIKGYPLKCITPEWLVKFHTGYQFDENDYRDVKALCQRFRIEMPVEFEAFEKKKGLSLTDKSSI